MNQFRQLVQNASYPVVILKLANAHLAPPERGSRSPIAGDTYYEELAELIVEFARQHPEEARRSLPRIFKMLDTGAAMRWVMAVPTKEFPLFPLGEPV